MFQNIPPVTKNILIVNVLVCVLLNVSPGLISSFSLHFPTSELFQPWQLLTHMFSHVALFHLIGNMFAVFFFGAALEHYFGAKRYLTLYLFAGLGSLLLTFLVNYIQMEMMIDRLGPENLQLILREGHEAVLEGKNYINEDLGKYNGLLNGGMLGASGAVFGILIGFAMKFPNQVIQLLFPPIPLKAKHFVMIYGAMELLLAFRFSPSDNVAHFAHLGGLLFGYILIKYWDSNSNQYRKN